GAASAAFPATTRPSSSPMRWDTASAWPMLASMRERRVAAIPSWTTVALATAPSKRTTSTTSTHSNPAGKTGAPGKEQTAMAVHHVARRPTRRPARPGAARPGLARPGTARPGPRTRRRAERRSHPAATRQRFSQRLLILAAGAVGLVLLAAGLAPSAAHPATAGAGGPALPLTRSVASNQVVEVDADYSLYSSLQEPSKASQLSL